MEQRISTLPWAKRDELGIFTAGFVTFIQGLLKPEVYYSSLPVEPQGKSYFFFMFGLCSFAPVVLLSLLLLLSYTGADRSFLIAFLAQAAPFILCSLVGLIVIELLVRSMLKTKGEQVSLQLGNAVWVLGTSLVSLLWWLFSIIIIIANLADVHGAADTLLAIILFLGGVCTIGLWLRAATVTIRNHVEMTTGMSFLYAFLYGTGGLMAILFVYGVLFAIILIFIGIFVA